MESFGVTQDFYGGAIPDIDPLGVGENSAGDEGNGSVAEWGDKSNNDSSPPDHVDVPEDQVQKINVDLLNYDLKKRKPSVWYKTYFWKTFHRFGIRGFSLCRGGRSDKEATKQINKEDTSMTYFPETAYHRPLVPNY